MPKCFCSHCLAPQSQSAEPPSPLGPTPSPRVLKNHCIHLLDLSPQKKLATMEGSLMVFLNSLNIFVLSIPMSVHCLKCEKGLPFYFSATASPLCSNVFRPFWPFHSGPGRSLRLPAASRRTVVGGVHQSPPLTNRASPLPRHAGPAPPHRPRLPTRRRPRPAHPGGRGPAAAPAAGAQPLSRPAGVRSEGEGGAGGSQGGLCVTF